MAKTNLRVIPMGTYAAGGYDLPQISVGKSTSAVELFVDISSPAMQALPDVPVAEIEMFGDDGASIGKGVLNGGPFIGRGGAQTERGFRFTFPGGPVPANYRVSGHAQLFQELTIGARLTAVD